MSVERAFAYDSFRPGQRELATRIYEHCLGGGVMLTEAMSGFGKTAAVLAGGISAAEETGRRIIYTCRTKRQIQRVADELSRIQKKRGLRAAALSSKFDYCLLKKTTSRPIPRESFGWYCGFNVSNNLCSYFMNVALLGAELERAVESVAYDIPAHARLLTGSESIHVCPYELVRLAALQAEVVVVPYQYVFDPRSRSVLFDTGGFEASESILIVDEAHNIRDFLRGTRSGVVTLDDLDAAAREADALLMLDAARSLKIVRGAVETAMKKTPSWYVNRDSFVRALAEGQGDAWLQDLAFTLNSCSAVAWHSVTHERRLPASVLRIGEFLLKLTSSESGVLAKWDRTLGLIEPNPVDSFADFLATFRSSVLLSATVNPSSVFIRSLGLEPVRPEVYESRTVSLVTVKTLVDTGVTTKYKSRSPQMYSRISSKVTSIVDAVGGGVGVFLPSYSLLEIISDAVSSALPAIHAERESRGMTSQEAADVVDALVAERGVLFGVQGGRFSEGEDFRGDTMDAVVVVGLSLPPPSPLLYAEYACLKRAGETDSYLMLSRLPALRKAFQAAGRHIREPGKKGLVFLLDHRFNAPTVRELMPSWLRSDVTSGDFTPPEIRAAVNGFWGEGRRA